MTVINILFNVLYNIRYTIHSVLYMTYILYKSFYIYIYILYHDFQAYSNVYIFFLRRNREGAIKRKTLLLFDILPRNLLHDPFMFHYCFVRILTHAYLYALRTHIHICSIYIYKFYMYSICYTRGIFFVEWKIKLNGFQGSARRKLVRLRVRTTWCPFGYSYYCDADESFFAIYL
jgi:hypothetical protein